MSDTPIFDKLNAERGGIVPDGVATGTVVEDKIDEGFETVDETGHETGDFEIIEPVFDDPVLDKDGVTVIDEGTIVKDEVIPYLDEPPFAEE